MLMGLWRSWERARLAVLRSGVRSPSAPPYFSSGYCFHSISFKFSLVFLLEKQLFTLFPLLSNESSPIGLSLPIISRFFNFELLLEAQYLLSA